MSTKKPMEIVAGVKYSGYGTLNEFGEWHFTPSQVGRRQGQKSFVVGDKDFTIYTTKKKVIVHLTIERCERMTLITKFCRIVDKLLGNFKDYDFRCISTKRD